MLEKLNVYNELSGITTNQSEGYNTLLKHYGHWKEAPLDTLILGLYQLQVFYHNEIQRGYSGMGSYSLLDDFSHAAIAADEVISIAVTQPADIVSKIRSNEDVKPTFTAAIDDRMENQDVKPTAAMDDCMEDQDVKPTTAMDDCTEDQDVKPTATMDDRMEDQNEKPTVTNETTQLSRARYASSCTYL